MEKTAATAIFEALSSGVRLEVFRLLVKHAPGGLVAGEIAAALDIAPNNLSFHLKALSHAGLVAAEQEGRYQRYRPDIAAVRDVIAYLTAECCTGTAACADLAPAACCPEAVPSPTSRPARSKR